jgi:hypothetical protein
MPIRVFFIIIIVFITSGCADTDLNQIINNEIKKKTKNFPQLERKTNNYLNTYTLVRSVVINKPNVQIQLRSEEDVDDPQEIIVVINSKNEIYVIPFLSNTYPDYWNFKFENGPFKTQNTFDNEMKNCFTELKLNDSNRSSATVLYEILISLLHCTIVQEKDSIDILNTMYGRNNENISEESSDSCRLRNKKNYAAITKEFHLKRYFNNYNAYLDSDNGRIYQIEDSLRNKKYFFIGVNVYKQSCNWHMLLL